MRGRWDTSRLLLMLGCIAAVVGCKTTRDDTVVPLVEEYRSPPDEPRFNNPAERLWKPPPPKKEFKPSMGAGSGAGGPPMGSPGTN